MADNKGDLVCKHPVCDCAVPKDDSYSSEYCENADDAGVETISRECTHAGCAGELTT